MTQLRPIDVDYRTEGDDVYVRVFCKQGKKNVLGIVDDFRPYFYVVASDTDAAEEEIRNTEFSDDGEKLPVVETEMVERTDLNEEKEVLKVYGTVPPKIPKLKSKIYELETVEECREYDIPFYKRFLIDKQVRPTEKLEAETEPLDQDGFESEGFDKTVRVKDLKPTGQNDRPEFEKLAFDLEVYQDEIIMASLYSEGYRKLLTTAEIDLEFVETVDTEASLIERFIEIVAERDIDVLTGYNTDEFDFKVLRERCERHGVKLSLGRNGERMKFKRRGRFSAARLKGRMHLDLYPFIEHVMAPGLESETLDLDSVAEELLGENKEEMSWEEMKESWREKKDLETFAEYALKDSELAFKLSEEIVPQIFELSRITGLIPFDACRLTYGQLTENYLLREAFARDMVAPNRPTRDERSKRRRIGAYEGGFVYTPEAGIHENIALLDFRSLYPTVMVSHNISPDTLNLEGCEERLDLEEYDFTFCQDDHGFFPELVESLVEDRYQLKEEMNKAEKGSSEYRSLDSRQQAEKILANSFYGYLGYDGARWYSRECAQATTFLGRKYIQDSIKMAEDEGFEVVYGDTDSLFIKGEAVRDKLDDFLEKVNSQLPSFMELENEGFFKTGFFTSTESGEGAKKKYALMKEDGSMKITGFEQVRRDWSPIAKDTQEKVLRKVLEGEVEEAAEAVKKTIESLREGEVDPADLKIYTKLTKKPENYDSTAPHVEAAKKAIERGEDISPGDTVAYVVTRGGGNISSRAETVKYADDYDSEYYIDNQIIPVSLRALKVFGYTEDQLKGKGKQSGLGRFG